MARSFGIVERGRGEGRILKNQGLKPNRKKNKIMQKYKFRVLKHSADNQQVGGERCYQKFL